MAEIDFLEECDSKPHGKCGAACSPVIQSKGGGQQILLRREGTKLGHLVKSKVVAAERAAEIILQLVTKSCKSNGYKCNPIQFGVGVHINGGKAE